MNKKVEKIKRYPLKRIFYILLALIFARYLFFPRTFTTCTEKFWDNKEIISKKRNYPLSPNFANSKNYRYNCNSNFKVKIFNEHYAKINNKLYSYERGHETETHCRFYDIKCLLPIRALWSSGGAFPENTTDQLFFSYTLLDEHDSIDQKNFTEIPTNNYRYGVATDGISLFYNSKKLEDAVVPDSLKDAQAMAVKELEDYNYLTIGNNVLYNGKLIKGAEAQSFVLIHTENERYTDYSQDQNSVYYKGVPLPNVDSATFTMINDERSYYQFLSKDKNHVWTYREEKEEPILQTNLQPGIEKLDHYYSKNKTQVFYANTIIENADVETFTPVPPSCIKPSNNCKDTEGEICPISEDLNCISTTKLNYAYAFAKDKNHFYQSKYIIKDIVPESFEWLHIGTSVYSPLIAFDKNRLFDFSNGKSSREISPPLIGPIFIHSSGIPSMLFADSKQFHLAEFILNDPNFCAATLRGMDTDQYQNTNNTLKRIKADDPDTKLIFEDDFYQYIFTDPNQQQENSTEDYIIEKSTGLYYPFFGTESSPCDPIEKPL